MKKRLGTVLLLALFVISSMMPTSAATAEIWNEARASHYEYSKEMACTGRYCE